MEYRPREIERAWQQRWREAGVFAVRSVTDRPKYYILDMFPYPSGHGLHVGHLKGYIGTDVVARYKRMCGYDVLHPMGWDSFGLPTERQAEKDGITPQEVTRRNVAVFRRQLDLVGLSYDWDRAFATSDPRYYRWTQWIFLQLLEHGLAYQADVRVNWCPALGTVLANEEVKDGAYIETGDPVEQRVMRQWMLKITAYADRLLEDLDLVDWPEEVKELQRNWIGRSEGATIRFDTEGRDISFEVFTTRPETLFGGTFCVLAPEHPSVLALATADRRAEVEAYVAEASKRSSRDRRAADTERTGCFTGAWAVNPASGRRMPIWVSDYVLLDYGTGAVFGCPAHDERDSEFAEKFGLDVVEVVAAHAGKEVMVRSDFLDGLSVPDARDRIVDHLADLGKARRTTHYNLRDWLFSRQRYWGEPIPVIHREDGTLEPVTDLPLVLPDVVPGAVSGDATDATDTPRAPLERVRDWILTRSPSTGAAARREANVMPQWAGSCWYYLRFIDPQNDRALCDPDLEKAWMPVDLYVGGIEHAVLHLLYARFWHKFLYDRGIVSTQEPFLKLFNQGKVHARSFRDARGKYLYPEQTVERDGVWYRSDGDEALETRIEKMSKSRYNVVSPEAAVERYGADSLRLYEVFMGPLDRDVVWQTDGISGLRRFLDKTWRLMERSLAEPDRADSDAIRRLRHQTIRKVTADAEALRLNTAVSQLMIFVNEGQRAGAVSRESLDALVRLLAPFAPHVAEEMWARLGHPPFVLDAEWPRYDEALCAEDSVTVVVQVNGRVRANLVVPADLDEKGLEELALRDEAVERWTAGKTIAKIVHVPGRLLNLVVR